VLIDESHRTQHGTLHAGMRKVLPNACYLGFTGTPLVKKEKNDIDLFGGFIDTYTIDDARRDEVVCDLIYEGRYVEQNVNQKVIDQWFERVTKNLTDPQKEDLKRKFSTRDQINQTDQRLMLIAYDINDHFTKRENLLFKGQIIATSKASAIKYKRFLDQIGDISSEVVISAAEVLEGHEDIGEDKKLVQDFWKDQMDKYGTPESYQETIINSYKKGDKPEIIIVVNKLITGFDAPQNTYLYIDRKFQEPHSVLQAIARVNRLYPGKEFGYLIDYAGVYGEIDDAKKLYAELLESFDEDDIQNSFADIKDELEKLPQRHSNVKGIFKGIETRDIEAYEQLLADEEIRDRFFDRLSTFNRTYRMAINSVQFEIETDEETLERYRLDHKFFNNLRRSVQNRYNLTVDLAEYDPQMKRILDTNVDAIKVEQIIPPTNIFDVKFEERKEEFENPRAKADFIASATEKTITEKLEDDPEYYKPLSDLLKDIIKKIKDQRITEAEYLQMVLELEEKVKSRTGDDLPERLEEREPIAKAYYGFAFKHLKQFHTDEFSPKEVSADIALKIDDIILEKRIRDWTENQDVKNQMLNEIEDFLFDLKARHEIDLSLDAIDDIMSESMKVAERRRAI
jgi:type I restriction enzyme R subunit